MGCFNFKKTHTVYNEVISVAKISEQLDDIINSSYDDSEFLYVILPYFNYCGCKSRYKLFIDFVNRYNNRRGIRICIIEARLENTNFELPKSFKNIYKHIGITTTDPIWIKENLINMMVKSLPTTYKYIAWIDADITFLNESWVEETISNLSNSADIIQLFQTCVNMGPDEEAFKIDRSFAYMYKISKFPWTRDAKYGFWHSGYAWACTKDAYTKMDGLIDYAILGAADHHMALALIGKVDCSHPGSIHENYKKLLKDYETKCLKNKLRLDYIQGTILHHWHGKLADRKYRERWNILITAQYDPLFDTYRTNSGYNQLTTTGKRLTLELYKYFIERNEDSTTNN
jgi:hypothetical protein